MRRWLAVLLSLFAAFAAAHAQVTLNSVFTDHMVLQREHPIHVWGMAPVASTVQVTLHGEHAQATADTLGRWSVDLAPLAPTSLRSAALVP